MAGVDEQTAARLDAAVTSLGGGGTTQPLVPSVPAEPLRWTGADWTRNPKAPKPENAFGEPIPEQAISEGWWCESLTQLHPDSFGDMTLPLGGIVIDYVPEHPDAETGELHETLFAVACEVGRPVGRLDVRRVLMPRSDVAWAKPASRVMVSQLLGNVDRIVARHRGGRADGHTGWLRTVQHLLVGLADR